MKLIIDIDEEMYDWIDNGFPTEDDYVMLWEKIRQGTPLSEELEKEEQKDKLTCDRNICLQNEYNNIGCEDCIVTKGENK